MLVAYPETKNLNRYIFDLQKGGIALNQTIHFQLCTGLHECNVIHCTKQMEAGIFPLGHSCTCKGSNQGDVLLEVHGAVSVLVQHRHQVPHFRTTLLLMSM